MQICLTGSSIWFRLIATVLLRSIVKSVVNWTLWPTNDCNFAIFRHFCIWIVSFSTKNCLLVPKSIWNRKSFAQLNLPENQFKKSIFLVPRNGIYFRLFVDKNRAARPVDLCRAWEPARGTAHRPDRWSRPTERASAAALSARGGPWQTN